MVCGERSNSRPLYKCITCLTICVITEFLHPLIESGKWQGGGQDPGNLATAAGSMFRPSSPHGTRMSRHVGAPHGVCHKSKVGGASDKGPSDRICVLGSPRDPGLVATQNPAPNTHTHLPLPSFLLSLYPWLRLARGTYYAQRAEHTEVLGRGGC